MKISFIAKLLSSVAILMAMISSSFAQENDIASVWIELRDGSILKVKVNDQSISWLTVEKDGSTNSSLIRLSEIKRLELTTEPASAQVARIRTLLDQLRNDNYKIRNEAEKSLIKEGGPFIELIQIAGRGETSIEFRYRLQRILRKLSRSVPQDFELDMLVTNDDKTIEGDVQDWKLVGTVGDSQIELDRQHLHLIHRENPISTTAATHQESESLDLVNQRFIEPGDKFYVDSQVHVSFDKGPDGESPKRKLVVDDYFSFLGCRLACENIPWSVVISGFQFGSSKSENNSVGNHYEDPETGKTHRYHGVMEVTFCEPGRPNVPAMVKEFGCYLEIVRPRHTLIEAYNFAGHRIVMQEASTDRSSFVAIKSNEPIARVRIMPNEYLNFDRVEDEDLNEDFAVDDICFSTPVVAREINTTGKYMVVLDTGERVSGNKVRFAGDHILVEDRRFADGLKFQKEKVLSVLAPYRKPQYTREGDVMAMLKDGSVVKTTVTGNVEFVDFPNSEITELDELVGLWSGTQALYPEKDDFQDSELVLVYPTCRFAASAYERDGSKMMFDTDSLTRLQQNESIKIGAPDPENADTEGISFDFDSGPSVWFGMPRTTDQNLGIVRLLDGQQFVLGGESGFTLKSTTDDSLTIAQGDTEVTYTLDKVDLIRFAK